MDGARWSPTFHHMTDFFQIAWVQRTVLIIGGAIVGFLLERVVVERAHRIALKTRFKWDDVVVESVRGVPTIWLTCAELALLLAEYRDGDELADAAWRTVFSDVERSSGRLDGPAAVR